MYEEKEIKYKKRKKVKKRDENKKNEKKEIKTPKIKNNKKKQSSAKKETKKTTKKKKKTNLKFNINIPPILKRIDYKKLITELVILILVMMLLIFTISRIRKYHENLNKTFNNNIETITNATIHYFEKNALPKNIGDSSSFILEEIKNLHLIEDLKDNENNNCDTVDSYIILTKMNALEYRLKIYLKCPNKEKVVEQKINCNEEQCSVKK